MLLNVCHCGALILLLLLWFPLSSSVSSTPSSSYLSFNLTLTLPSPSHSPSSFSFPPPPIPSCRLSAYADEVQGLDQYAIRKFGEAFDVVPRTLAENSGGDPTTSMHTLHGSHLAAGTGKSDFICALSFASSWLNLTLIFLLMQHNSLRRTHLPFCISITLNLTFLIHLHHHP